MNEFPYQYDSSFSKQYQESGCYAHCVAKIAYEEGGFQDSNIRTRINAVIEASLKANYITDKIYVLDPDKVFLLYGVIAKYGQKHEAPEYVCAPDEREILCFNRKTEEDKEIFHFVVGYPDGSIWDPLKRSRTVAEGFLASKRIFKILGRV